MEDALQHALVIQQQKDVQAQILDCIQHLVDLPATSSPSPADAKRFTALIAAFQPGDVDALIEERNADDKCGYVLCRHAPRSHTLGPAAVWKIGGTGMCFCSTTCTRRLDFVKAQLCSTPAWERVPGQQAPVVLHEDEQSASHVAASEYAQNVRRVEQELARERGEKGAGASARLKAGKVVAERIVEKRRTGFSPLNSIDAAIMRSTAVEGYEPKVRKGRNTQKGNEDEEDDDESD